MRLPTACLRQTVLALIQPKIAGALILGLPSMALAFALLWRRQRPVFFLSFAMILVGLGYLMATGATDDVARIVTPGIVAPPASR